MEGALLTTGRSGGQVGKEVFWIPLEVSEYVSKLQGQSESTGHTLKQQKSSELLANKCLVESVVDS